MVYFDIDKKYVKENRGFRTVGIQENVENIVERKDIK